MSEIIRVPIAGTGVGKGNDRLYTVVGSCIAIMLYDKKFRIGGLVHIMLGYSHGQTDNPSKYADTAVPYLIKEMVAMGAAEHRLAAAKIAGGGEMFESLQGEGSVSRTNIAAVQDILPRHGIRIIASDLGGTMGRRITFDVATGRVYVQIQGQPTQKL